MDREQLLDRVEFLGQGLGLGSPGEAESQIVAQRRGHRLDPVGVVPAGEHGAQGIEEKVGFDLLAEPLELARSQGEQGRGRLEPGRLRLPPGCTKIGPLPEHKKQRAPDQAEGEAIDGHRHGIPLEDHPSPRHDSADHQRKHRHVEERHRDAGPDHARAEGPAAEPLKPPPRVDPGQDREEHRKACHASDDQPEPACARWKQPVAQRENEGRDAGGHQAKKRGLRRPEDPAIVRSVAIGIGGNRSRQRPAVHSPLLTFDAARATSLMQCNAGSHAEPRRKATTLCGRGWPPGQTSGQFTQL